MTIDSHQFAETDQKAISQEKTEEQSQQATENKKDAERLLIARQVTNIAPKKMKRPSDLLRKKVNVMKKKTHTMTKKKTLKKKTHTMTKKKTLKKKTTKRLLRKISPHLCTR